MQSTPTRQPSVLFNHPLVVQPSLLNGSHHQQLGSMTHQGSIIYQQQGSMARQPTGSILQHQGSIARQGSTIYHQGSMHQGSIIQQSVGIGNLPNSNLSTKMTTTTISSPNGLYNISPNPSTTSSPQQQFQSPILNPYPINSSASNRRPSFISTPTIPQRQQMEKSSSPCLVSTPDTTKMISSSINVPTDLYTYKNDYYKCPNCMELSEIDVIEIPTTYDIKNVRTFKTYDGYSTTKRGQSGLDLYENLLDENIDDDSSSCSYTSYSSTISSDDISIDDELTSSICGKYCKCKCHNSHNKNSNKKNSNKKNSNKKNIKDISPNTNQKSNLKDDVTSLSCCDYGMDEHCVKEIHIHHFHCPNKSHDHHNPSSCEIKERNVNERETTKKTKSRNRSLSESTDQLIRCSSPKKGGNATRGYKTERPTTFSHHDKDRKTRDDKIGKTSDYNNRNRDQKYFSDDENVNKPIRHPYNNYRREKLHVRNDSDSFGVAALPGKSSKNIQKRK